jgi:ABC-type uncharacterized transport system involved in gliding motility auxiliary subunit
VILKGDREVNMPYLDPRREEFLEYDISEALMQLVNKEKPKIGVLSSMQLDGNPHGGQEGWVLMNFLRRNYEAETIAADANSIKEDIKLLLVIHPKALSDKTQYAIDQFLVRGGKLIVAVDPMSRVEMSMSDPQARMMGGQANFGSSLDKLFTAWNIEFNSGELVGDATYTTQVNAGGMGVDYPFFMSLGQAAFVTGSPVTGQLNQMLIAEGGAIASKADSPYTFEPLLETTTDSGTIGAQMAGFMGPDALAKDFKPDGKKRTLAAMVRGKFKTAFPGGYKAPPPPADDKEAKPEEPPPGPHIETAENEGAIVVIGDVDFMHDSNSVQVMRFGPQSIARPINDNLNFVFNSIDLLAGSEDLISIRSRGKIARPFTKVAEIQKDAAKRWKDKEEQLSSELTKLETQLNDMQKQRTDGNRFALTPEQQDEIKKFRAEEARLRKERRLVRKNLREDIESLGHLLIALNMLVVPLGTSAFGFSVFMRRARRMRQGREQ